MKMNTPKIITTKQVYCSLMNFSAQYQHTVWQEIVVGVILRVVNFLCFPGTNFRILYQWEHIFANLEQVPVHYFPYGTCGCNVGFLINCTHVMSH